MSKIVALIDAAFKRELRKNTDLVEENKRLRAEISKLTTDRGYTVEFDDGYQAALMPLPEPTDTPPRS
ncbi:hypothetical protein [Roseibium sp.]|uniref:hypothetical protein n=1 Tax=Roseibium sp. TaxID=1936156 RepID=UPI003B5169E7